MNACSAAVWTSLQPLQSRKACKLPASESSASCLVVQSAVS
eukprot:CAMPEP_0114562926 /NCGR_PEP_ID=MMETSP0114-20121206/12804_1 /TAXON_ID=31324 /ORGANISM="Goniomonas sp, Strain m" /LENGTH=40 /DNA_ID= /DNA_START= /DNA_END= /DNA_ORIENTATION=